MYRTICVINKQQHCLPKNKCVWSTETELQWLFIQDKSEVMIGRDREFQLLMDYSCGASNADMKKIGERSFISYCKQNCLEDFDVNAKNLINRKCMCQYCDQNW